MSCVCPSHRKSVVDGSCLIRIKPITEEQREMSERCVRGLGYQGNNLFVFKLEQKT